MYSNFFCRFLGCILSINQGYTYSNISDLSRKISAMSIAGFRYLGEEGTSLDDRSAQPLRLAVP